MNLHLNNKAIHRDDRKSRETVNKKKRGGGDKQTPTLHESEELNIRLTGQGIYGNINMKKEKSPQKMIVLLIALTPLIIGPNLHARFTVGFVLDVLQFAENVKVE